MKTRKTLKPLKSLEPLSLKENRKRNREIVSLWVAIKKLCASQVQVIMNPYVGHGLIQYTAFSDHTDSMLGFVLVRDINPLRKHAVVYDSWVVPHCRRKGVRSILQDHLLREFDLITSPHGTVDGEAWMRSYGYKYNPVQGQWEFWKGRITSPQRP